jgi:predicted TIM-barrel fold metal-dependent hydrolase
MKVQRGGATGVSAIFAARGDEIRSRLSHPVIDADGHTVEVTPVVLDFVKQVGGTAGLARFEAVRRARSVLAEDRCATWSTMPGHWVFPAHTLDRATAALPRLYHDRLDELGLDVSLVYPTMGLRWQMLNDDELRPVLCRALNLYMAEMHRGLTDRLLPVAAIPMHTPGEAIAEMEYAVNVLGLRAVLIPSFIFRPIPRVHRERPEYDDLAFRFDTYGMDSEYDYDPVWAKCLELKVVPGVHTPSNGLGFRRSMSNYVYNHIGSFAASCEAISKSLLMGGVFHRFPQFKVAALEGGVGWAASMYADFLGHWEKRNPDVIDELNPARLDGQLLSTLVETYGSEQVKRKSEEVLDSVLNPGLPPAVLDEFAACPFQTPEEIREVFVSHVYIGCEADDPMNALAFDSRVNPFGARFRILFGSDISHWDVPDVSKVLEEAYELVEKDLISEDDFKEFTFANAAELYGGSNPDFFKGTRVESAVAAFLGNSNSTEPAGDSGT